MDLEDKLWDFHTVTKMEAAQRQLDTAISLWFNDGDEVSVHTLVGAAYHIIHALNAKRGGDDLLFNADAIPPERRHDFREAMRKDFMFFKHAERDPDAMTVFFPFFTMYFLMGMLETLKDMGEKLSDTQLAFSNWVAIFLPDLLTEQMRRDVEQLVPPEQRALMRSMSKSQFFEVSRQGSAQARAQGRF